VSACGRVGDREKRFGVWAIGRNVSAGRRVGVSAYARRFVLDEMRDAPLPSIISANGAHTPARIRPYPTGRLFWGALFQALRARLRSRSPSGTLRTGSSQNRSRHKLRFITPTRRYAHTPTRFLLRALRATISFSTLPPVAPIAPPQAPLHHADTPIRRHADTFLPPNRPATSCAYTTPKRPHADTPIRFPRRF
jgi:hypothetical protein